MVNILIRITSVVLVAYIFMEDCSMFLSIFSGFTCRCGGLFCSIHRYSDKHECNFDYKELGAQEIRKSNPVVMAEKVKKI